jgi:hypothetical protein
MLQNNFEKRLSPQGKSSSRNKIHALNKSIYLLIQNRKKMKHNKKNHTEKEQMPVITKISQVNEREKKRWIRFPYTVTFLFFAVLLSCCRNESSNANASSGSDGNKLSDNVLSDSHACSAGTMLTDKGALPDITGLYKVSKRNVISDFVNMYHPMVVKTPDVEYPYRMYFFGWSATDTNIEFEGCDAIFVARSRNLDIWEIYSKRKGNGEFYWNARNDASGKFENVQEWYPVIVPTKVWYDDWHNGDPSVVYKDGTFYMAYSAYGMDKDGILKGLPGDTDGDIGCIMGAISTDGIVWKKSDYPLAIWEPEIGKHADNDFKRGQFLGLYHRPSILWDEGKWKMWFDYITANGKLSVGYAENEGDFMKRDDWHILYAGDKEPLVPQYFANPDVIKIGETYFMYGDPVVTEYGVTAKLGADAWAKRQLLEMQSGDGIHWTATGFIMPDSDTWANQIPVCYYEQGHLFLFYATQIGYGKVTDNPSGSYDFRYNNIRYMTRCIDYQLKAK